MKPTIEVVYDPSGRYPHRRDGKAGCYRARVKGQGNLFAESLHVNEAIRKLLALLHDMGRSRWLPDYQIA